MPSYDPKKVKSSINDFVLTGFGEDSMIEAGYAEEDRVTKHVDAQGDVDWSETSDESGEVTFTLKQDSPGNAELMQLAKNKEEFSFTSIDQNVSGDVAISADRCRVKNIPDYARNSEKEEVEWVIDAAVLDYNLKFSE